MCFALYSADCARITGPAFHNPVRELAGHPGVISCQPQSKCPVRPPVRWELPISSFFGCIKSSLRLSVHRLLAASLQQKQGEVGGDRPCGKLPHH